MSETKKFSTDNNCRLWDGDLEKLAEHFQIPVFSLEQAMDGAQKALQTAHENVSPASKEDMGNTANALRKSIEDLSQEKVRARLHQAIFEEPENPGTDNYDHYIAWCDAGNRLEKALSGAMDLLQIVEASENYRRGSGRPSYQEWTLAVFSLVDFWATQLNRKVTISAHPDDGRKVNPSPLLEFVYACMKRIDGRITETACRSILLALKRRDWQPLSYNIDALNYVSQAIKRMS